MNNQQNSINNKVINKIKSGNIKMKPKIYFVLRTALLMLSILVLVLFIVCLISFIAFSLRSSGVWLSPAFGFPCIKMLFGSLPWVLILITVVLIVLLEIFAKKFTFVYRKPILYSLLIIILVVFLGGFLIDKTPFHSNLFWKAQEGHLPGFGSFYRDFGNPKFKNIHQGVVSEVINNGFLIENHRERIISVMITPETRLPSEKIEEGDVIVVFGERDNGQIEALNIRKTKRDFNFFPKNRFPKKGFID